MRRISILALLSLFSCNWEKFEGYSPMGRNVHMKVIAFTDGQRVPSDSDIVTYRMTVFNRDGQVIFSSADLFPLGLTSSLENSGHGMLRMNTLLRLIEEGDSASFMIDDPEIAMGDDLRSLVKRSALRVDVRLLRVRTRGEYERELSRNAEIGDVEENLLIADYIKTKNLIPDTLGNGLFMVRLRSGTGEFPEKGQKIRIRYSGSFLGGAKFDEGELQYNFGEQMQVIRGLEIGVSRLRLKGKAKIIIPSSLAYGAEGSSNGTVPPSTPVVYEIERLTPKSEK